MLAPTRRIHSNAECQDPVRGVELKLKPRDPETTTPPFLLADYVTRMLARIPQVMYDRRQFNAEQYVLEVDG